MRRPTILFMNRIYPPAQGSRQGATGRVLRDLARGFAREGWQVSIITTGPTAGKERDGAIRVIRVKGPEKPGGAIGYCWIWLKMFFAALHLPATHILVTMTDPPLLAIAGHLLKRIKKNKHIHWCHDVYPDILPALDIRLPKIILKAIQKRVRHAMDDADKVIVIGRCMARYLSYRGVNPRQMAVIPNWPDLELCQPDGSPRKDAIPTPISRDFGPHRSHDKQVKTGPRFRVLYAGNIGLAHPIQTILGAAEILNEEQPDIEFLFVGNGPRYDLISKLRAERHLDNIKLLPFQPASRLRELMESGDVHLISMKEETSGMLVPSKLYAALAVQRPCIFVGPAHCETAKVITDYKAGAIIPQGHAKALAERILTYRQDGDAWFAAHKGAAQAGQTFIPKSAINAWIERAWAVLDARKIVEKPQEIEQKDQAA